MGSCLTAYCKTLSKREIKRGKKRENVQIFLQLYSPNAKTNKNSRNAIFPHLPIKYLKEFHELVQII